MAISTFATSFAPTPINNECWLCALDTLADSILIVTTIIQFFHPLQKNQQVKLVESGHTNNQNSIIIQLYAYNKFQIDGVKIH